MVGQTPAPSRKAEAMDVQAEPGDARKTRVKVRWDDSVGVKITGEYCLCLVRMPAVKNWLELDGKRLRQVVAEFEVEIEGSGEVTTAHARIPEDFEFVVGAGGAGQGFHDAFGGCVLTLLPEVQALDLKQSQDFLGGDDRVDGKTKNYKDGERRLPRALSKSCSSHTIRVHADAANSNAKNGACAVAVWFRLEPGASMKLQTVECTFYR